MVRVSECCCGCSLRTGTLILLWITVIGAIFDFYTVPKLLQNIDHALSADNALLGITLLLYLVDPIVGFITGIYGLNGIHRNIAKYLTPQLYFMYFEAALTIFTIMVAVFHPNVFYIVLNGISRTELPVEFGFPVFTISSVVQIYFCVVVRSYRDSMRETSVADSSIPHKSAPPPYSNV